MSIDERLRVFLTDPTEVFRSVEDRHEIWKDDPFDVESVHLEARESFAGVLTRATMTPGPSSGRILLVLGESGAGKTHLVRTFRSQVHKNRVGFVAYMQMTSASTNYARYVLSNLIDSLDQPYDEAIDTRTSLMRIAGVLASRAFDSKLALLLRDDPDLEDDEVADLVRTGADRLIVQERYQCADLDLLRAFLYLHRPDPRIKSRILKYLRCEDLSEHDRARLDDITPRIDPGDPERMIERIGRLAAVIGDNPMSLVICLDQFEDMYLLESSDVPFRRAMTTVRDLAERLPTSIFVVCCLEELYDALRKGLAGSLLDRIEKDPAPVRLRTATTQAEAKDLVETRLRYLYTNADVALDEADALFPFTPAFFKKYDAFRARAVLDACQSYRARCRKAGELLDLMESAVLPVPARNEERVKNVQSWDRRWNDFLADISVSPPESDEELAELLAWAIARAGEELESGHRFPTTTEEGAVRVSARAQNGAAEVIHVAICNRTPKFGWLARQISQHTKRVQSDPARPIIVLARNDAFSRTKTVEKEIAAALKSGGRSVVIQNADWRVMLALQKFGELHGKEPFFVEWLADENHLSRLGSIRQIVDLDHLDRFEVAVTTHRTHHEGMVSVAPRSVKPLGVEARPPRSPLVDPVDTLLAGTTLGLSPRPVILDRAELTCHAAFLGGSGSGKTTLALSLVEQLLIRGIPVILLDRKGDLAGYARPDVWSWPHPDPVLDDQRKKLLSSVDVALFTPGHPEGRPISITVAPDGLAEMSPFEREEAATHAAQALGDMLGYRHTGRDATLRAILIQAIQVLAQELDRPITLDALIPFISDADPALVAAVGRLDTKLFALLVQNLETLKLTATQLFATGGEPLDVDLFFGTGPYARPGRARLTIISTKFLRDDTQIQFWVAQMLLAVLRWGSKRPKSELQAVLLVDEADLYLPALRQPATKGPMESLLKRGRSAGIGVLLATQSPGDLDYRCRDTIRTWFLGRIKEQTALMKLKPMVSESPIDVLAKLPGQEMGEFHVAREGLVTHFQARRSVLVTEQIPDSSLLVLARRTREGEGSRR
jgi:energy-coupling factor transporter ATP-binding protein EcfA2